MDILFWKSLKPNSKPDLEFKHTKKQFFGRYLWRLEIHAECSDLVNPSYKDMMAEVAKRRVRAQSRNFGGSWRYSNIERYDQVDYVLLQTIRNIRDTYKDSIKVRCEDPWVQFYAETETELKVIAQSLSREESILAITGPVPGTEAMLSSDKIIASKKVAHRYKIMLRDGNYNREAKAQILALLEAQGAEVKVPASLRHGLTREYAGMWGTFFYANEDSVTTMLNLVYPGIVGKIHEVIHLD
jgi:hypothetical protein